MSIMTSPYKHPKSGIYYFRMGVPKSLVSIIGKTSFKSSLNTKNLTEAKQRFGAYLEDAHKQIELAKLKLSSTSNIELNARDCAIIAERWYEHTKAEVEASGDYHSILERTLEPDGHIHEFGLSDTFSISGYAFETATEDQIQQLSEDLQETIAGQLDREGLVVSVNSDSFRRLAVAFYGYVHHIESLCRARHKRDFGYEPVKTSIAGNDLSITRATAVKKSTVTKSTANSISNLFGRYKKSESLKDKGAKGLNETTLQIERLIEVIGDIDVTEVSRGHIVEYRDTLLQLPRSKAQEIRSKSLSEQVKLVKDKDLDTLSATTAKNCLRKVSVVFSYAVEVGLIDISPLRGVKVATTEKKTEVGESKGYTDAELRQLFQLDVFNDVNVTKSYGMACYWVPLLCRYTGARLEEIAQLHKSDIAVSEGDIHYLNIRRGEGQSVKTNSSLRHIPVPDHLIELGFLDYVGASTGQLFPQLKENKYGNKSAAFSKWWSKVVKKAGVSTSQPSHAFRHSFKTALRSLEVADTVSDAITGHTAVGVGGSYGTVELKIKKAAIDRLPRLALTKLQCPKISI